MKEVICLLLYSKGGVIGSIISQTPGKLRYDEEGMAYIPNWYQGQVLAKTKPLQWRWETVESIAKTRQLSAFIPQKAVEIQLKDSSVWTIVAPRIGSYNAHVLADELCEVWKAHLSDSQ